MTHHTTLSSERELRPLSLTKGMILQALWLLILIKATRVWLASIDTLTGMAIARFSIYVTISNINNDTYVIV